MRASFYHEVFDDSQPEDAGTITVTATILGDDDDFDTSFTTSSLPIQDFFGFDDQNENYECQIIRELMCFLQEADIDADTIRDVFMNLVAYVLIVTCFSSSGYSPGCDLSVELDLSPYYLHDDDDDSQSQIEEAAQVSFHEITNNTRFRPASKLVVKSLIRKIYKKKKNSLEECTICLEEFKNGGTVVPLACGHEFDDECIVKWLETSHVCPLCRYEFPCEDQMN
ncbi:hypothetical protein Bca4012_097802 [Brassica carinata]|uniref:RING-type domain-containing protein n=2 Tax=Brassica TaxID=3705 RepID=A0ABQ7YWA3_BRANA|nr:E3 ubiquitin ligase BIG BROTHER-related [Brassica napus]KAF3516640.1 hypothetical protein DY000_02058891 [Brassica cretica]KAH0872219.1 hypothetical protein HID58_069581 [Brassica napus]